MPGLVSAASRRRRRRTPDDEGDDGSDSDESRTTIGSKRPRLSMPAADEWDVNGASSSPGASSTTSRQRSMTAQPNGHVRSAGRDPESFQPGSIVRMKLVNFVTYTEAEFHLGPNLNMILGPNGTGKSTFVCAVCVGLGWPATIMGRAKEVGEYIKRGTEEAVIEIELAAAPGMPQNPVVRRKLRKDISKRRDGSTSTWYINSSKVPQKDVDELVRTKLSIQIDNLCQFLPQDRVVEFSGLTPTERLEKTLEATASPQMQQWHQDLKALDKEQQAQGEDRDREKARLAELQAKQANQRGDVEKIVERKGLVERREALEKFRCVIKYRDAKNLVEDTKVRFKEKKKDLARFRQKIEPAMQAVHEKTQYVEKVERWHGQRQKLASRWDTTLADELKKHDNAQKDIEGCNNEFDAEKKVQVEANSNSRRVQNIIKSLKVQQQQEPPPFDPVEYNRRIRDAQHSIDDIRDQATALNQDLNGIVTTAKELVEVRDRAEKELERLKTESGQQTLLLRKISADTAKAWEWVQENQDRFQSRVYGPPLVECSVKDRRYTSALESTFGRNDLLAFTVTNAADREMLADALTGRDGMRLVDITIKNAVNSDLSRFQSPCTRSELQSKGLDGWALDFLTGPDPVLSILCDFNGLHRTALSLQKHSDAQFEQIRDSEGISKWVDKDNSYTVTRRREYGPKAVSTATRPLEPAKYWTANGQSAHSEVDRELREKRDGAIEKISGLKDRRDEIRTRQGELKDQAAELETTRRELSEEKEAKQKLLSDWKAIPIKLQAQQTKLKELNEQQAEWQDRVNAIHTKKDRLCLEKAQMAKNYADHVANLCKALIELQEAELWLIEARSDLEVVTEKNKEANDMLAQTEADVNRCEQVAKEAKARAMSSIEEVKSMMAGRTEGERDIQETLDNEMSAEHLNADIETTKNRLDLLADGDPRLLQDYEERAKTIQKLEEKLRDAEADAQGIKDKIEEIRREWEPRLDSLVGSISEAFSDNFSRIGCAGQVSVHKDERFENWSIMIEVKFRDNEPLSALTSQRQSGGERSVSTMLYLLSLHAQSMAPFRVVDEINQGMDPRNERMMHERIVDISCEQSRAQYFLVTPKLLTDLKYHPRMRIHFIQSGESVPIGGNIMDPMRSLQVMRALAVGA